MKHTSLAAKKIAFIGILTALTCILAPLSIPVGLVPVSLTNLVIYFGIYILGTKMELISCTIYLLIGLVGLPVFSGFTGGPGKLFGPTGGYLIGFLFMILVAGIWVEKSNYHVGMSMVGMMLGTIVCYAAGTAWLAYEAHLTFSAALMIGVVKFVAGDLVKMALAAVFAPQLRRILVRADLLSAK